MKKLIFISLLLITATLFASFGAAAAEADEKPTYDDYKKLGGKMMIAYCDGKDYAFYGLGKFDLDKPYNHGDKPDYTVFTKYYNFDIAKIEKNTKEFYDESSGITVYGKENEELSAETCRLYAARFALYEDVVYGSEKYDFSDFAGTRPESFVSADYKDRLVGLAYSTWMYKGNPYPNCWETPYIGKYTSLDSPDTLRAHAELMYDAGVDFIFVDWSNNVDYDFYNKKDYRNGIKRNDFETIESATTQLFESWSKIENTPNIAVFIGCPGDEGAVRDGRLQKKADQVYREYLENEEFAKKYQLFDGKPLLLVYLGTPAFTGGGNPARTWTDDRFTVRFVTGFMGQQGLYNQKTRACKLPIWSWEEREQQVYTINGKNIECMTVHCAHRSQSDPGEPDYIPSAGRDWGMTFLKSWARAKEFGLQVVLLTTWNEYSKGEQPTSEINKDLEPTVQSGTLYYDIMKEQIKLFKNLGAEPEVQETEPVTETSAEPVTEKQTEPVQTEKQETKETEKTPETEKTEKNGEGLNIGLVLGIIAAAAAVSAVCTLLILKKRKKK